MLPPAGLDHFPPSNSATGRCRVVKSSELPFLGILGVIGASAFHVGQVGGEQGKNMDHHGFH